MNEFGQIIKGDKSAFMKELGDRATALAPFIYERPWSFLDQLQARLYISTIAGTSNLFANARRVLFRDRDKVWQANQRRRRV